MSTRALLVLVSAAMLVGCGTPRVPGVVRPGAGAAASAAAAAPATNCSAAMRAS